MPIIEGCDYLLDIHSTHTSGDPAFICIEEGNEESLPFAKSLGVDKICLGWGNMYQEEDFSTEGYALKMGTVALTLECGYHNDASAHEIALRGVNGALNYTGIIPYLDLLPSPHTEYYRFKFIEVQKDGDVFTKSWKHMDAVKRDECVYISQNGTPWLAPEDGCVLIPNPEASIGDEMFYFGIKENL